MNPFIQARAIVISHPNSGRNWVEDIIGEYRRTVLSLPAIEFTHDIMEPPFDDILPWQDMVEVSTNPIRKLGKALAYEGKPIVVLSRDPRDVIVSYFYQKTVREPWLHKLGIINRLPNFTGNIDEFIEHDIYGIKHLILFMNLMAHWIKKGAYDLRYEAMHEDIELEMVNLLNHIGVERVNRKKLNKAIAKCTFERVRKAEENEIGKKPPEGARKYRSGKVGTYKDELSSDMIRMINAYIALSLSPVYGEYRNG